MNSAIAVVRPATDRDEVDRDLQRLVTAAAAGRVPGLVALVERQLTRFDERQLRLLDEQLTLRLMSVLAQLWEDGWQPADVVHVDGRADGRTVELVNAVISEQGRRTRASDRAPQAWMAQLSDASAESEASQFGGRDHRPWRATECQLAAGWGPVDAWTTSLVLVGRLESLPRVPLLLPPPSAWAPGPGARPYRSSPGRSGAAAGAHQERLLRKIRALLAKAEASGDAGCTWTIPI